MKRTYQSVEATLDAIRRIQNDDQVVAVTRGTTTAPGQFTVEATTADPSMDRRCAALLAGKADG